MKVEMPAVSIEIELEIRKPRGLVEYGDRQAIHAARRLLDVKEHRERMLAPARHAICGAGLKRPPILGIFAMANAVNGILLRVDIVDSLAAKFVRRIIESADPPDQCSSGEGRQSEGEHRDQQDHPDCRAWTHLRSPLRLTGNCARPPWIFNPRSHLLLL